MRKVRYPRSVRPTCRQNAWHCLRSGRGQMTPTSLVSYRVAEAGLGQNEDAVRHARHAAEIVPPSVDAVLGPGCEMRLAQVLAMTGDRDGAFDKLGKLVKLPFGLNHGDLKLNPMWDDLRDDSRFDRILAESALPLATKR